MVFVPRGRPLGGLLPAGTRQSKSRPCQMHAESLQLNLTALDGRVGEKRVSYLYSVIELQFSSVCDVCVSTDPFFLSAERT